MAQTRNRVRLTHPHFPFLPAVLSPPISPPVCSGCGSIEAPFASFSSINFDFYLVTCAAPPRHRMPLSFMRVLQGRRTAEFARGAPACARHHTPARAVEIAGSNAHIRGAPAHHCISNGSCRLSYRFLWCFCRRFFNETYWWISIWENW